MPVTNSDIVFTLSGGTNNSDPEEALGGDPSIHPIASRRLFSDISTSQSKNGFVDYRCFYLNNLNELESLYETDISISYRNPGDVVVDLGFYVSNERQNIFVTNATSITGGTLTLTYTDSISSHDRDIDWDSNSTNWASNIQTGLRTIDNLEDVIVNKIASGSNLTFEINFLGAASKRFHEMIVIKNNTLSPATSVSVTRSVIGGPVNQIPDAVDISTTKPNNVDFLGDVSNYYLGDLRPLDFVPIWVHRVTPIGADAVENDGFVLKVTGKPVEPSA